jgi:parvulin-like peptidyl-prolyl isomerase
MTKMKASRVRTQWYTPFLLGVGAAVGILLSVAGAFVPNTSDFSGRVIARVNGKGISVQDLEFALGRLSNGRPTTHDQRLQVLQHLIDQELLIQRGVEIGLLDSDRAVRKAISMAVIDAIVAGAVATEPTEEELYAFYASQQAVFTFPARVHVRQIYCAANGDLTKAKARAEQAVAALSRGVAFAEVREGYGDSDPNPPPDALVPVPVLQRSLGPTLTHIALTLKAGAFSPPVQLPTGYHILHLVEYQPEHVQSYDAAKQTVRAEYFRRERDDALQTRLDHLRQQATIVFSPQAQRIEQIVRRIPGNVP